MNKIDYYAYYVDNKGIMTIYAENNSVAEISECNGLNKEELKNLAEEVLLDLGYKF